MAKANTDVSRRRGSSDKKRPVRIGKASGKLYPLSMRTTREVRKRLEEAAAKNGRSLASEVEERLLASFTRERRESEIASQVAIGIHASFGGEEVFKFLRLLSQWASIVIGPDWHKDDKSIEKALGVWKGVIDLRAGLATYPTGKKIEIDVFQIDVERDAGYADFLKTIEKITAEKG